MRPKYGQRLDIVLICIALLSVFLNIYNIWNDTYANAYYTAAVTSMLQSWHNFFFASFDPAGFITLDKPPVTFWVQTIFAYIFGVHGWSVILPQALAGVGSVLLIYKLVKPNYGQTAARFASLVMACSPIAVAVSRTNNIDSLLVFTLLLATWMLFRGIYSQKLSWIMGAFAMIGVGFNMKMLQAYMVLPAFYLFYILACNSKWMKKLAVLTMATVILIGVSMSWAVIVDSIPQDSRPYIGGSQTNSVLELTLGYNGMQRLTGMNRGGNPGIDGKNGEIPDQQQIQNDEGRMRDGSMPEGAPAGTVPPGFDTNGAPPDGNTERGQMPNSAKDTSQGKGMGGGQFGTGQAGPLRLFQSELSGQISWLLPFAAFACIGLLAGIRRKKPLTAKQNEAFFWLAWLLPGMVFFSVAGFFHQYYLIMLAPPIAALVGAGWVELLNLYRNENDWKKWFLPAAIIATTAFELYILKPYQGQIGIKWSIGIGAAGIVLSLILILSRKRRMMASIAATLGMLVLLAAPLYWSATPILYGGNSMLPQAGPEQNEFNQGPDGQARNNLSSNNNLPEYLGENNDSSNQNQGVRDGNRSGVNSHLLEYLNENYTGEKYFLITTDASTAEAYIISTGKAVVAMGGFSGSDPALTVAKLELIVNNQQVKYFLIPSGSDNSGPGGIGGGSTEVLNWIRAHCTEVPKEKWQSNDEDNGLMRMAGEKILYQINQ